MYINLIINNKTNNLPKYSSIKSSIYREINKKLPDEINSLDELNYISPFTKKK